MSLKNRRTLEMWSRNITINCYVDDKKSTILSFASNAWQLHLGWIAYLRYGRVIFLIKVGCFKTNSFHSCWSILPSPFLSASLNVCKKRHKNFIIFILTSMESWGHYMYQYAPYPQWLRLHHLKVTNLIHAKVPTPSPSTVNKITTISCERRMRLYLRHTYGCFIS